MLPGGKPERGETPEATALRELHEEVGLRVTPGVLTALGRWTSQAANEVGHELWSDMFELPTPVDPADVTRAGEIAELRWLDPAAPGDLDLAPMLREHVLAHLTVGRRVSSNGGQEEGPPR